MVQVVAEQLFQARSILDEELIEIAVIAQDLQGRRNPMLLRIFRVGGTGCGRTISARHVRTAHCCVCCVLSCGPVVGLPGAACLPYLRGRLEAHMTRRPARPELAASFFFCEWTESSFIKLINSYFLWYSFCFKM